MPQDTHTLDTEIRDTVRQHYAAVAIEASRGSTDTTSCCSSSISNSCGQQQPQQEIAPQEPLDRTRFGTNLYSHSDQNAAGRAVAASLGCGVPTAVADLHPGEIVLDLGSGAGTDVLIAARRVAPGGKVIGLDMTTEMLDLARLNADASGLDNVEFVEGYIEDIPLPAGSVDVIISNCVINLAADKQAVLKEAARVLRSGGRFAISDVIAGPDMDDDTRAGMAAWTGCIAGALTEAEYRNALSNAGFENIEIIETHRVHPHAAAAIVRAQKPTKGLEHSAATVEVFDPPMCCSTGVCGPSVDPALATFAADLTWLAEQGVIIERYNLSQDPKAFVDSNLVRELLAERGNEALPVVVVNGALRSSGCYPSRKELVNWTIGTGTGNETGTGAEDAPLYTGTTGSRKNLPAAVYSTETTGGCCGASASGADSEGAETTGGCCG